MFRPLALVLSLLPLPALAHPHVFISTGVEAIFDDQGHLTHLRVTWEYDDLYSLFIQADYGIDADGDGQLSDADRETFTGFDANWVEGYEGDLEARLDGQKLSLSGPTQPTLELEEGRIVTSHLREVLGTPKLGPDTLSIKAFDPSYYTAYDLDRSVTLTNAGTCRFVLVEPDIDATLSSLRERLARLDETANPEDYDIPAVGANFATDLQITCPPAS